MGFEPATSLSQVLHRTTQPPRTAYDLYIRRINYQLIPTPYPKPPVTAWLTKDPPSYQLIVESFLQQQLSEKQNWQIKFSVP